LYRYELSEIEAIGPDPDEVAELAAERERLRHAEGLREAAAGAAAGATGGGDSGEAGAARAVAGAAAPLAGGRGVGPGRDAIAARLAALSVELGDVGSELRGSLDGIDSDPERLAAVEERLAEIDRLTRKHGGEVGAVLAHAERCRAEIERLESSE